MERRAIDIQIEKDMEKWEPQVLEQEEKQRREVDKQIDKEMEEWKQRILERDETEEERKREKRRQTIRAYTLAEQMEQRPKLPTQQRLGRKYPPGNRSRDFRP